MKDEPEKLIGQRFGSLEVQDIDYNRPLNPIQYICKCDCGKILSVLGTSLKLGRVTSCRHCILKNEEAKSFIGKRFNHLTVISIDQERCIKGNGHYYICKCDCGNITSVNKHYLTSGHIKSCGCSLGRHAINFKSLIGKRFGKLTVIDIDYEKTTTGKYFYICKCDCGNIKSVAACHLRAGDTTSCGCYKIASRYNRKHSKSNEIIIYKDLGFVKVFFSNCDDYFICDIEDLDIVRQYCWHKNIKGYAQSNIYETHKTVLFHRLVIAKYYGDISGKMIDHIDHVRSNNRKENLRICNPNENSFNRRPTTNTGEQYIHFDERTNKYLLSIPQQPILSFSTIEDAKKYKNDYFNTHPNPFLYNSLQDKGLNNKTIIVPFVDLNGNEIKREVIKPFYFV